MRNRKALTIRLTVLAAGAICSANNFALADTWTQVPGTIKGGKVTEKAAIGTVVGIQWTGVFEGNRVNLGNTDPKTIGASGSVDFPVPATSPFNGHNVPVTDANQFCKFPLQKFAGPSPDDDSAQVNWLHIAAFHPVAGGFEMYGFTNYVADNLGEDATLRIPDLFADTNGDQSVGSGDLIYSTVNLVDFLPADLNFNFGDTFMIVNGSSPLLPGMLFGTAPVTPNADSSTGYDNPSPYTGSAVVQAEHDIVVPEPAAVALLTIFPLFTRRDSRRA